MKKKKKKKKKKKLFSSLSLRERRERALDILLFE